MRRIFAAITAAVIISAAAPFSSSPAEAGGRGCRGGAGSAAVASGDYYGFGRYGRYEFGYCAGYGYGDQPAYFPPAYYEHEPAYDGYTVASRGLNLNFYYDFPAYRRVDFGPRPCCRPYW